MMAMLISFVYLSNPFRWTENNAESLIDKISAASDAVLH